MNKVSQHAEWLSMVEISGPFLAIPVLERIFPQGLESIETYTKRRIRSAYEEWRDAVENSDIQLEGLHQAWVDLVLTELLEYDDSVLTKPQDEVVYNSPDGEGEFRADYVLESGEDRSPILFISILPSCADLEKSKIMNDSWSAPIFERMSLLCRQEEVRLGLITNGERWMLVNAPIGNTSSHVSWYARLWFQEPVTLRAFRSLFGVRRWFGPKEGTLTALLEESLQHHEEVTDTLGEQVKRAVEVLLQCLDKVDQDRNRELLYDVSPAELYEAGLTVMMRLVFVLCAEERKLLLQGDPIYDQCYAISTLRGQLTEAANQYGYEVLERRHDAWARLLAVFRAIYAGIDHEALRMPALGGSLFDPDRFPFLEGRKKNTNWKELPACPLPIDNRTVLLLLEALQILEQRSGALLLSYKALDVEQIGHVYEGLLEYTVQRLSRDTLGLTGSQRAKNPNISLAELESARLDGEETLVSLVQEVTQRSKSAITKILSKEIDSATFGKVISVCGGNMELANKIKPFVHLLRMDARGGVIVYRKNSFAVALGADRRETGTHYTPKSLTESIVNTTLEPIVYIGPAEGKPREEWQIKSPGELLELKICDPAMGSGAFLVQGCKWLAEKLVDSWGKASFEGKFITVDGIVLDEADGAEPMPDSLDERLLIARRLVAERCLYGVDMNPLAVELAKLSIWLITLAKGRPFGFLDHNLRSGDSLLGIHNLQQLFCFDLCANEKTHKKLFAQKIDKQITEALVLRKQIREISIRDIRDVQYMEHLYKQARQKLDRIGHIADAIIGEALSLGENEKKMASAMQNLSVWASSYLEGDDENSRNLILDACKSFSIDIPAGKLSRQPFHWVLEFPEVFERGGFDAVIGNPPFMGGKKISHRLGNMYFSFIKQTLDSTVATTDLCVYFMRRSYLLINNQKCLGLLLSDIVSQGHSRKSGLLPISQVGGFIYNAIPSRHWPGSASVKIAHVHIYKGSWFGNVLLENHPVSKITSYLKEEKEVFGDPYPLMDSKDLCFSGHFLGNQGFVISKKEAENLVKKDPQNEEVIFRYIRGNEINNEYSQEYQNKVINFGTLSLFDVENKYPDCFALIKDRITTKKKKWWLYTRPRPKLNKAIYPHDEIIVQPFTAKYLNFSYVKSNSVFAHPLVVVSDPSCARFAVLVSSFHEAWVREYCSTNLDLMTYTASCVFDTYPFPTMDGLERAGISVKEFRDSLRMDKRLSLNEIYNKYNNASENEDWIKDLRSRHVGLDKAVALSYGWGDLQLDHDFYETLHGIRFTISEVTRAEILKRLLQLNHKCYAEEVARGLHDKKRETLEKSENSLGLLDYV